MNGRGKPSDGDSGIVWEDLEEIRRSAQAEYRREQEEKYVWDFDGATRLTLEDLALENLSDIEIQLEHELREGLLELLEIRRRRNEIIAARTRRTDDAIPGCGDAEAT